MIAKSIEISPKIVVILKVGAVNNVLQQRQQDLNDILMMRP